MTGYDLLLGMGYLDDGLVDEALRAASGKPRLLLRRGLAAACAALVIAGGVLAAVHFTAGERGPAGDPGQADYVPAPTRPPAGADVQVVPPDETPTPAPRPQGPAEADTPENTAEPQTETPPEPSVTDAPGTPRPADRIPDAGDGPQAPSATPVPQAPRAPASAEPAGPDVPYRTPDPGPAETPASLEPSETNLPGRTEYAEPMPDPTPDGVQLISADNSFYLSWQILEDGFSVKLSPYLDRLPYRDYDSDYTGVRWEADGFDVLARETVTDGERFSLKLSSGQPEGVLARFTVFVMDGEKEKAAFSFYGVRTDRGLFGSTSTAEIWSGYYEVLYRAGEISYTDWILLGEALRAAGEPLLTNPAAGRESEFTGSGLYGSGSFSGETDEKDISPSGEGSG